jgi:hypothetical protein
MKIVKKLFKLNNFVYVLILILLLILIEFNYNFLNVSTQSKPVKYVVYECIDDHGWLCGGWVVFSVFFKRAKNLWKNLFSVYSLNEIWLEINCTDHSISTEHRNLGFYLMLISVY